MHFLMSILLTQTSFNLHCILIFQSFLAVEDMKVFSVFAEMSESMEEDGVSIRIQDMTASWNSPGDRDHDSVTDKLVDNVSTYIIVHY